MKDIISLSSEISATHCAPRRMSTLSDISSSMLSLETIEGGHQYWIGDLLNFAEEKFGEAYANLVAPDRAEAWRQYKWVCRRVPRAIRDGVWGYSYARWLAPLSATKQKEIIKENPEKISVKEFRLRIKNHKVVAEIIEPKYLKIEMFGFDMKLTTSGGVITVDYEGRKVSGRIHSDVQETLKLDDILPSEKADESTGENGE